MIKITSLYSSSSGNSILIQIDEMNILIDAGWSFKRLKIALANFGLQPEYIDSVFITHNHNDHTSCCKKLESIGCHICRFSEEQFIAVRSHKVWFNSPWLKAIPADHDELCMSFIVGDRAGNKVAVITDTGTVSCELLEHLIGCNVIVIECNHDVGYLEEGPYPDETKIRVLDTHLNNTQAGDVLELVADHRLKHVISYHISAKNNSEALIRYELERGLKCAGVEVDGVSIQIAPKTGQTRRVVLI